MRKTWRGQYILSCLKIPALFCSLKFTYGSGDCVDIVCDLHMTGDCVDIVCDLHMNCDCIDIVCDLHMALMTVSILSVIYI
jgi:hypothetical protein